MQNLVTGAGSFTSEGITEKLSAALGRTVKHAALPPEELAATLKARGLPPQFADDVAELARGVADGSLAATTPAVRDLTGHPRGPSTSS
jgi:uncharacterized protein YbjT (DUF2867 family)